jgi:hypothetical protein
MSDPYVGMGGAIAEPVMLTPIELDLISAEYLIRPPDLLVHINRRGEWYWTHDDAQIVWEEFLRGFDLEGEEDKLLVEFIPEAYGWCVTVSNVAAVLPPKNERIEGIIQAIEIRKKGV